MSAGGTASDTTEAGTGDYGVNIFVVSGGTLIDTAAYENVSVDIYDGAVTSGTSVYGAGIETEVGGTLVSTTVFSGGQERLEGGTAFGTTVSNGGIQYIGALVSFGGSPDPRHSQ